MLQLLTVLPPGPDGELVEEGRKAVHIAEELGANLRALREGDNATLRTPCDRARPVEADEVFRAPRQDEFPQFPGVERLDASLEPRDLVLRDPRNLRIPGGGDHRELRPDGKEIILDLDEEVANGLLLLRRQGEPDYRVQLVHRAHRLNAGIVLRNALGSQKSRLPRIARAGVELRHQPTQRAAAFRFGAFGNRSGCKMCATISSPSTSRGPGRLK